MECTMVGAQYCIILCSMCRVVYVLCSKYHALCNRSFVQYHVVVCGIHLASREGAGSAVIQLNANFAIMGVCDRVGRG